MKHFFYPIEITHIRIDGIIQSHYDLGNLGSMELIDQGVILLAVLIAFVAFCYLCKAAWWVLKKLLIGLSLYTPEVLNATIDGSLNSYFKAKNTLAQKVHAARLKNPPT